MIVQHCKTLYFYVWYVFFFQFCFIKLTNPSPDLRIASWIIGWDVSWCFSELFSQHLGFIQRLFAAFVKTLECHEHQKQMDLVGKWRDLSGLHLFTCVHLCPQKWMIMNHATIDCDRAFSTWYSHQIYQAASAMTTQGGLDFGRLKRSQQRCHRLSVLSGFQTHMMRDFLHKPHLLWRITWFLRLFSLINPKLKIGGTCLKWPSFLNWVFHTFLGRLCHIIA